jgi:hypothetical protein
MKVPTSVAIPVFAAVVVGATTAANFVSLLWFGMWMGMTSKNANLATAKTLIFVHVVPWLMIIFASWMVIGLLSMAMFSRPNAVPSFQYLAWYPLLSTLFAAVLALAKDVGFFVWSRKKLNRSFREQAARGLGTPRLAEPIVAPPPLIPAPPVIA